MRLISHPDLLTTSRHKWARSSKSKGVTKRRMKLVPHEQHPNVGKSINTVTSCIYRIFIKSSQLFPVTLGVHLDLLPSSTLAKRQSSLDVVYRLYFVNGDTERNRGNRGRSKESSAVVETKGWCVGGTSTVPELPLWATFSLRDSPHEMPIWRMLSYRTIISTFKMLCIGLVYVWGWRPLMVPFSVWFWVSAWMDRSQRLLCFCLPVPTHKIWVCPVDKPLHKRPPSHCGRAE